jgi:hypothetical protein
MMTKEEMNDYLESIGGLENGMYSNKPKITSCDFFDVQVGWYPLIKNLINELINLGWDKQVTQVKEKFGGLRFYINGGSDEMYNKITEAEKLSHETCELCGKKGELRTKIRWFTTLCDEHYEQKHTPFI